MVLANESILVVDAVTFTDANGWRFTLRPGTLCCGHRTLPSRGTYDMCSECNWEGDGQDDHDSALVRRGPNGGISLKTARQDYLAAGCHPRKHGPKPSAKAWGGPPTPVRRTTVQRDCFACDAWDPAPSR